MHSSTSNSERPFFIALVATFAVLLVGYELLVRAGRVDSSRGITFFEENIVKAQQLRDYPNRRKESVALGSSLTANLYLPSLDGQFVDLAFRGGNSLTGFEILQESGHVPKFILVEMTDTLKSGLDKKLLRQQQTTGFGTLRSFLFQTRQEYRPISVGVHDITSEVLKVELRGTKTSTSEDARAKAIAGYVRGQSAEYSPKESADLDASLDALKSFVDEYLKKGTRVVLFNPPVSEPATKAYRYQEFLIRALNKFPPETYTWLKIHPRKDWVTNDGSHLVKEDADVYAAWLLQEVKQSP